MTIFYYTATGNSLYVAKKLGGTLLSIPQVLKSGNTHYADDVIGIVYPCYAYGLPASIKDFFAKVTWEAKYSFAVITYGFMIGAAYLNLEQTAQAAHKQFDYVSKILMVDNYLLGFEMDKERRKEPKKNIEGSIKALAGDIAARKKQLPKVGATQRFINFASDKALDKRIGKDFANHFDVSSACTKCGICTKVCPTGNITIKDGALTYASRCECCMACMHACPQNAIHIQKEKSGKRFRNQHVTLKEIIASNDRSDK